MNAANIHSTGAASVGPHFVPTGRPPPVQRVVEPAAGSTASRTTGARTPVAASPVDELARSARQFVEVLELTGSVSYASAVSGFRAGSLDTYG